MIDMTLTEALKSHRATVHLENFQHGLPLLSSPNHVDNGLHMSRFLNKVPGNVHLRTDSTLCFSLVQ